MYEFILPWGPPPSFDTAHGPLFAAWLLMTVVGCVALLRALRLERRLPPPASGKGESKTDPADHSLNRAA